MAVALLLRAYRATGTGAPRGVTHAPAQRWYAAAHGRQARPATETYCLPIPEGSLAISRAYLQAPQAEAAQSALQATLAALHKALGGQRPTLLLLFTSAPRQLATAMLASLHLGLASAFPEGTGPVAVAGCTAGCWADEGSGGGGAPHGGSRGAVAAAWQARSRSQHHVSLAAAVLPGMRAHTFYTLHDSLPELPYSGSQLLSAQPQLLLLAHPDRQQQEDQCGDLLKRFEAVFPGSALAGAVARQLYGLEGAAPGWQHIAGQQEFSFDLGASGGGRRRILRLRAAAPNVAVGSLRDADDDADDGNTPTDPAASSGGGVVDGGDASALLMMGERTYTDGSVGVLLDPLPGGARLGLSSSWRLVRLLLGGNRFGGALTGTYTLPTPLLEEVRPAAAHAAGYEAPDLQLPATWRAAAVTPAGLQGSGIGRAQQASELPLFALDLEGGLWPGQVRLLRVFEPRYQWLVRCCTLPASGGGADGGRAGSAATGGSPAGCGTRGSHPYGSAMMGADAGVGSSSLPRRGGSDSAGDEAPDAGSSSGGFGGDNSGGGASGGRRAAGVGPGRVFGIAAQGFGTTAAIKALQASDDGCTMVEVVGGRRFRLRPGSARVLPATFGLTAAQVEWVEDEVPGMQEPRGEELLGVGRALLALMWRALRCGAQEALERHADEAGASGGSGSSGDAARDAASSGDAGAGVGGDCGDGGHGDGGGASTSGRGTAVGVAADDPALACTLAGLTPSMASELSLALAPAIPASAAARARWFQGRDARERLRLQLATLTDGGGGAATRRVAVAADALRGLAAVNPGGVVAKLLFDGSAAHDSERVGVDGAGSGPEAGGHAE